MLKGADIKFEFSLTLQLDDDNALDTLSGAAQKMGIVLQQELGPGCTDLVASVGVDSSRVADYRKRRVIPI